MIRAAAPRRTQHERRTATIRKLLDAATEALIDLGYAGATVQAVCDRADLSQGGLFRHFPSREALMVAVGEDVGAKLLTGYRERFEALRGGEDPMELAMKLVREQCQSRLNQAWYELALAARTNETLRVALEPTARRYYDHIERLARELLPDLAAALGPSFRVLCDTIVSIFDGEVIHRFVLEQPEIEGARIQLLATIVQVAIARGTVDGLPLDSA